LSPEAGPPRRRREAAFAAIFFLAVTVLMTWPQAAHLGDALTDIWDAKLNARILQWDFHQTFHDPLRLYQLNFFYPSRDVLAFSENLWGVSLFGFPLLAAGASPLANYNVLLLLGMFLSAWSAWALAREVTGDPIASAVAGLVFAFLPWRFSQLPHLQFQWAPFLCLTLLFLLRYLDGGRPRDAVLFGAAFAWNALCNVHYAFFGALLVAVALAVAILQGRGNRRRWLGALLAAAAGALVFLPFALPYREASALYGMRRYWGEVLAFSGRWTDFLSAGSRNRLYGPLTKAWRGAEGDFFPGLVPVFLAAFAVVRLSRAAKRPETSPAPSSPRAPGLRIAVRILDASAVILVGAYVWAAARPGLQVGALRLRSPGRLAVWLTIVVIFRLALAFPARARSGNLAGFFRNVGLDRTAVMLLILGAVGVVYALGAHTPFYRFLFQTVRNVVGAFRSPARAIVLFDLSLAILAAWGLSLLCGRSVRTRIAGTGVAVLLLIAEYRSFPLDPFYPTAAAAPPVYTWLSRTDVPGAVVEWPFGLLYDFDYVFRQAQHGRPILNGYSGFFPETFGDLQAALDQRPIPESVFAQMGGLGAGLLVYHSHEGRGFRVQEYADLLARVLDAGGLELVRSFPHEDGLDFVLVASGTPGVGRLREGASDAAATRRLFDGAVVRIRRDVTRLAPPFGALHQPRDGQAVAPGFWAHGWALDDSGIDRIEIATDEGPAGRASYGGVWPGLAEVFPQYPDARSGAFGFAIPALAPGEHRLVLTLVAKDGGTTILERRFSLELAAPSPTSKDPGMRRSPAPRTTSE
jgi:hypothetical protein